MIIEGKYTNIDVKASIIDDTTREQIQAIADNEHYRGTNIVIMPDTHAGKDCVIGFTMRYNPKNPIINPNIVGVDIGCGVLVQPLYTKLVSDINFAILDAIIHDVVDTDKGYEIENNFIADINTKDHTFDYYNRQIGTLGYGNHFIEVDEDYDTTKYILIHTGSRHLGWRVCDYYAKRCVDGVLCGDDVFNYLHDMKLAQDYAKLNRQVLMDTILDAYDFKSNDAFICKKEDRFESVHNYIDLENNIIRKGAVSAQLGEKIIIPFNMRDGAVIGTGTGRASWNYSAPHGAGRVLSRSQAKKNISLEQYQESMQGVYTTCINEQTIDESAFAYKSADVVLSDISDTINIENRIFPIYNFKNN